jgi:transcriptional regulator with XRE-family HTH domain
MFSKKIFCERLKTLRKQKGISQTSLGNVLGNVLGISKQAVSDIERGRRTTTIEKFAEITEITLYFQTSADWLLGLDDLPNQRTLTADDQEATK